VGVRQNGFSGVSAVKISPTSIHILVDPAIALVIYLSGYMAWKRANSLSTLLVDIGQSVARLYCKEQDRGGGDREDHTCDGA
jgi:hypothetical protein